MEPRELWDRNAVLAEAFCRGDERVKEAQARLDEAQADRSRVLAAFAVTVGSAGAVAGLFGLNEREVRIARRTVGKADARAVADELLAAAPATPPQEPDLTNTASDTPPGAASAAYPAAAGTGPAGPPRDTSGTPQEPGWSAAVDAVLIGSWQTGVDLRELAAELGLDLTRLVARAQQLSAQGRFHGTPAPGGESYGGRHRRGHGEAPESEYTIPVQQTVAWNAQPPAYAVPSTWHVATGPVGEAVPDVTHFVPEWDATLAPWGNFGPPHEEPLPSQQPWAQYHLSS
ncbi:MULTISPECIES: hypothetical protein [Streptomyces]|uniref:hypothetical protein n=1 Tax=Streptomyces TaxID=1883 RepID=UPI000B1366C4|nr:MULTISPECIES: hypothetical protein [Streptomyces]